MSLSKRLTDIIWIILIVVLPLFGCKNKSQEWQIGGDLPKKKILVDLEEPKDIKICSDKYKNIGFPVNLNVDYDDQTYYSLLEGLCITLKAKKIIVRFATPSSGKMAKGTFEVLQE